MGRKVIYSYTTWDKLELPIDASKNQLSKEIGCSNHRIDNAIRALDKKLPQDRQTCSRKLIRGRRAEQYTNIKKSDERDTTTYAFCWETKPLLKAIVAARAANNRRSGNELAKETFRILAEDLVAKCSSSSIENSYVDMQLLNDPTIQKLMIRQYQSEITKRLKAVEKLMENASPKVLVQRMLKICEKIDGLVADLTCIEDDQHDVSTKDSHTSKEDNTSEIEVKEIERLYDELMSVRTGCYRAEKDPSKPIVIDFRVPEECADDDLKEDLERFLPARTTCIEDPGKLKKLEGIYERFLLANIEENCNTAERFVEDFYKLRSYIEYQGSTEEEVKRGLREEIDKYLIKQFETILDLDYFEFSDSHYTGPSLQFGFLRERINWTYDHIRARLFFRCALPCRYIFQLNDFFRMEHYPNSPCPLCWIEAVKNKNEVTKKLKYAVQKSYSQLQRTHSYLLPKDFSTITIFMFLATYAGRVKPMCTPDDGFQIWKILDLLMKHEQGSIHLTLWEETLYRGHLLMWAYQIVAFYEACEQVEDLYYDFCRVNQVYADLQRQDNSGCPI